VPFKSKRLEGISFAIDAQDYDLYVEKMPSWWLHGLKSNYVTADWCNCPGGRRTIRLHRYLILGLEDNLNRVVDHINGDTLDNRRCNLRELTRGANGAHRVNLNSNNTSGVRGVSWCSTWKRWIASIRHNDDTWWKKSFEDKNEAIREIGEQRKVYNATHGISERVVQRLPELVEPNRLMKELYERRTYVNHSEQWRTDYNERKRRQSREKREKLKEELLNQPQTGEVIKELRRIESYELRAGARATPASSGTGPPLTAITPLRSRASRRLRASLWVAPTRVPC